MITEVVIFPIPKDMTREQVISLYEKSVPTWRANPDLIHKSFLYVPKLGAEAASIFGKMSERQNEAMIANGARGWLRFLVASQNSIILKHLL